MAPTMNELETSELLDEAWPPTDPAILEREPRPCLHPKYRRVYADGGWTCECGHAASRSNVKRGRTSLRAGKDAERAIAKAYPNGKRTGQFGGPDDVVAGEMFVIQSKAGGWFSERVWAELVKLQGSQRIPTLVISDRPGPGHRTRRYVVRSLEDDIALHGEKP